MRQYVKPECHFIKNSGGLSGEELLKLSDAELADYIKKCKMADGRIPYSINPGFMLREIAGEYIIVPVDEECMISNAVMTPNETAVDIWKAFQDGSTVMEVCRQLSEAYEASEREIRTAVESFVEDALKYGVLKEEV